VDRRQAGAKLDLGFSVAREGTYQLDVVLTKARNYGIVQLCLDGRKPVIHRSVQPGGRSQRPDLAGPTSPHGRRAQDHGRDPRRQRQAANGYMFGVSEVKLAPSR